MYLVHLFFYASRSLVDSHSLLRVDASTDARTRTRMPSRLDGLSNRDLQVVLKLKPAISANSKR